jgi:type III secretion protein N (ATPase)
VTTLALAREAVRTARSLVRKGRLRDVTPLLLRCTGAGVALHEQVEVEAGREGTVRAEVVALRGDEAVLLPLGEARAAVPGALVRGTGRRLEIRAGRGLLGRVLDGLGGPIDGNPLPAGLVAWEVDRAAPGPLERPRLERPFVTGIRAVDGFATLAEGQRIGLFAGPGAGKSSLLGRLARGSGAEICVVGLVGERGREVRELVEDALGPEGLRRSVVVVATSDAPAVVRMRSAQVATAVAEWFARVEGRSVLLLVD